MAERKIRHVGEVFKRTSGNQNGKTDVSDTEYTFNFNFKAFKSKQAPLPPGGPVSLPKIGNYQPKILLETTELRTENALHSPVQESAYENVERNKHEISQVKSDQLIIGDKDIPITVETNEADTELPMPKPRRKRRAPNVPEDNTDVIPRSDAQTTNNPLFGRSLSVASDEERFDMDIEIQGGDIDFGPGIDNPGFNEVNSQQSSISEHKADLSRKSNLEDTNTQNNNETGNPAHYPYIPPPDYDDEEVTMTFEEEERDLIVDNYQQSKVYREFDGEDFARYLQDDEDYEFDSRPPPMRNMKGRQGPPQSDRRFHKKGDNKKKSKRKETDIKRNTIRDFTFSDSKIGWGDRTVKSTSAKGRYIKREKDRKRIDTNFEQTEFLRVRNGLGPPVESPNSSDSGVEVEMKNRENLFYHSQPKQMKNGKYEKKPSVWQKLTWRFRKSLDISRLDKT